MCVRLRIFILPSKLLLLSRPLIPCVNHRVSYSSTVPRYLTIVNLFTRFWTSLVQYSDTHESQLGATYAIEHGITSVYPLHLSLIPRVTHVLMSQSHKSAIALVDETYTVSSEIDAIGRR